MLVTALTYVSQPLSIYILKITIYIVIYIYCVYILCVCVYIYIGQGHLNKAIIGDKVIKYLKLKCWDKLYLLSGIRFSS